MGETTQQTVDASEPKKSKGPKVSVSPSDMDLLLEKMKRLNAAEFRQSNKELGKISPEAAAAEWNAYRMHGSQEAAAIQASRSLPARVMGTQTTIGAALSAGAVVAVGGGLSYLLYRQYREDHPADDESGEL